MNKKKFNDIYITAVTAFSIAVIAFLAYRDVLGYYFTGIDTVAIIESVRIRSFADVVTIFSRPLAADTPMPQIVQACYRPVCSLLFSLDYAIWGLSPFGFNLTNVLLHALVSVLCFFVVISLTKRRSLAFISSVLFTLHPVLVEGVSVTVRRCDTLTTLFILLSLLSFLKYSDSLFEKPKHLFSSLILYALALGTKEIAVIFPFIIFTHLISVSFPDERTFTLRFFESIKKCLPYIAVTIVFIAIRTYVIGGMGGYVTGLSGAAAALQLYIGIATEYVIALIYPVDFLRIGALFSPYQSPTKQGFFLILLAALLVSAAVYRKTLMHLIHGDRTGGVNVLRSVLAAGSAISIICILSYPLISPYINSMIQQAYDGEGPQFLIGQMNSRDSYSSEVYIYKMRDIILRAFFLALLLTSAGLWATYDTDKLRKFPSGSFNFRLVLFLLSWMIMPLMVYLATSVSGRYYLYIAVIPFCTILSIAIVEGFHYTLRKATKGNLPASSLFKSWKIQGFAAAVLLSASLIWYSPLFHGYGEWKDNGIITQSFLTKLSQEMTGLPADTVLHIYNYPDRIISYESVIPHAKEVVYMNDYNIESWLNMNLQGSRLKVIIESRQELKSLPYGLKLETSMTTDKDMRVDVKYYW